MKRRKAVRLLGAVAGVTALWLMRPAPSPRSSGPLPHEAYVWQRARTAAVVQAVTDRAAAFDRLTFLAAEVSWEDSTPNVAYAPLEPARHAQAPVGIALRIGPFPGPFRQNDARALFLARLASSLVDRAESKGVPLSEFHLDFDCASSKLDGYRVWLQVIQKAVHPLPVVPTALPAWLGRSSFERLARAAGGYVLQVHSLERPRDGGAFRICDPARARRWVERAARIGVPFRVALPTYAYDVAFGRSGRFLGLSAEGPARVWPADATVRRVGAEPAALAALVRGWEKDRPAALLGAIWYRLSVPGDRLNWAWPTLAAVMEGREPSPALAARARRAEPGLIEIELVNHGEADAPLPIAVNVSWAKGDLLAADALRGFRIDESVAGSLRLLPLKGTARDPLAPGGTRLLGWLRFRGHAEVEVHAAH